jgi:tRNA threonylcarbamoyladenosine biosynthesis protein TsaB
MVPRFLHGKLYVRSIIKNFLALDTSTDIGVVTLITDTQTYARVQQEPREHNRFLLKMVQEVLEEAGLTLGELDAFICGVGPGSFVGVRLGVSVMQGLAYAMQKPVYALSSLSLQAQAFFRSHPDSSEVLIAHDARMQAFYLGHYQNANGAAVLASPEALVRVANQLQLNKTLTLAGNAAKLISGMEAINAETPKIQAEDLVLQARQVLSTSKALTAAQLQPVYFDDEGNWKRV